ncbi:hypothetical protein AOLI_G00090350 [Acnodon oligacanthus]
MPLQLQQAGTHQKGMEVLLSLIMWLSNVMLIVQDGYLFLNQSADQPLNLTD